MNHNITLEFTPLETTAIREIIDIANNGIARCNASDISHQTLRRIENKLEAASRWCTLHHLYVKAGTEVEG